MAKINDNISPKSKILTNDLYLSIVGQIRVFDFKENDTVRPGAIYGVSRCLRMLHEHFEAIYTKEANRFLNTLISQSEFPKTIREVYKYSSKLLKNNRKLYVEHTDGGVKKLAIDLLKLSCSLKNENEFDMNFVSNHINNNSFIVVKHIDFDIEINEKTIYNIIQN